MSRAYRLSYEPNVGKFVVEFQGFLGMYWKRAQGPRKLSFAPDLLPEVKEPLQFPTYAEARAYVTDIGLDEVYEDFTRGPAWKQRSEHGFPSVTTYPPMPQVRWFDTKDENLKEARARFMNEAYQPQGAK